jgi:hypothetical protein
MDRIQSSTFEASCGGDLAASYFARCRWWGKFLVKFRPERGQTSKIGTSKCLKTSTNLGHNRSFIEDPNTCSWTVVDKCRSRGRS